MGGVVGYWDGDRRGSGSEVLSFPQVNNHETSGRAMAMHNVGGVAQAALAAQAEVVFWCCVRNDHINGQNPSIVKDELAPSCLRLERENQWGDRGELVGGWANGCAAWLHWIVLGCWGGCSAAVLGFSFRCPLQASFRCCSVPLLTFLLDTGCPRKGGFHPQSSTGAFPGFDCSWLEDWFPF